MRVWFISLTRAEPCTKQVNQPVQPPCAVPSRLFSQCTRSLYVQFEELLQNDCLCPLDKALQETIRRINHFLHIFPTDIHRMKRFEAKILAGRQVYRVRLLSPVGKKPPKVPLSRWYPDFVVGILYL